MALLSAGEWKIAEAIAGIGYVNPFLPERMELEKRALGKEFKSAHAFLQYRPECAVSDMFPNMTPLRHHSQRIASKLQSALEAGEVASERELEIYEDLVLYLLYARYLSNVLTLPVSTFRTRPDKDILQAYTSFANDFRFFLKLPRTRLPSALDQDVVFAGLFQIERAFFHIFRYIVGSSLAAARLRASIWQSIFSHDMRRYRQSLYRYMGDIPTLITGPSGTGKELVAQAIAYSRYIPFDSKKGAFETDFASSFIGLNLSSISPALIESELFGHKKGAFTSALSDRSGYLDPSICSMWGSLLLDEIGELDSYIQVKLLRVLQTREFHPVGATQPRQFVGKLIAATNRDLSCEMRAGRFREDFYYRLCADRIETPSLRQQLEESPDSILNFVMFIATRMLTDSPHEATRLAEQATDWIDKNLGPEYLWRGNFRELEQCVRSILIRGTYVPVPAAPPPVKRTEFEKFLAAVENGELDREKLLQGYFSHVYQKTGSYRTAGQRLGVDWRTVKEIVGIQKQDAAPTPPS